MLADTSEAVGSRLELKGLRYLRGGRGRCLATWVNKVSLASPYFHIAITQKEGDEDIKDDDPVLVVELHQHRYLNYSNCQLQRHQSGHNQSGQVYHRVIPPQPLGQRRVSVTVAGLNQAGQISVSQVGDDASLRCQAVLLATSTPLHADTPGIRYGWDWRRLDGDSSAGSSVAVGIETQADSLNLRGVQAAPGQGGRGVKGRCVVHVKAKLVEPTADEDEEMAFASEYFRIEVTRKPEVREEDLLYPIPGTEQGKSGELD
ncbi:unnamed protein product [Protopolystoma xenopodis]|uniref:Uncharacterized protein n=1 Tax=Protopolystoma xenopodis TaxID=117903 RepID=A0A448WAY9_9PLAT|nr:unnamed protein product [Protopolystoma xenopodis]